MGTQLRSRIEVEENADKILSEAHDADVANSLGLSDEKDITLRGLEAIQKCQNVYIAAYTCLSCPLDFRSTQSMHKGVLATAISCCHSSNFLCFVLQTKQHVDGFLCHVWEKVDFIWYYEDVVTKRLVHWVFYTEGEQ